MHFHALTNVDLSKLSYVKFPDLKYFDSGRTKMSLPESCTEKYI